MATDRGNLHRVQAALKETRDGFMTKIMESEIHAQAVAGTLALSLTRSTKRDGYSVRGHWEYPAVDPLNHAHAQCRENLGGFGGERHGPGEPILGIR
jgi:hypothetical protein